MQWWTLKQLKSSSAKSRLSALEKLGAEGEAALIEPLSKLLSDADPGVRAATALALGRIKSESIFPPLGARLRSEPEAEVRRAILKALSEAATSSAIPAFVQALGDPSAEVAWQAAQALKASQWEPANDSERAALLLANDQFDAAIALGAAAIDPLINVAHGASFSRSIRAVEALVIVGGAQVVQPILDCLQSSDYTVRSAAATALGAIGDARALDPLIAALRDPQHQVCLAACVSLGKLADDRAVEPILAVLKHSAPDVRSAAVETLGKLRAPAAVPALLEALRDSDNDVRESACKALGAIGDHDAIEHLVVILTDAQTPVRQAAAAALARIQLGWETTEAASRAIPALQLALKSSDYWVRHSAGDVLKKLGAGNERENSLLTDSDGARKKRLAAQTILLAMLGDTDRALRQAAAETLGRMGLSEATPRLVECLADTSRGVKRAAARALEMLRWQTDDRTNKARQFVALERWNDAAALGDHAVDALADVFTWNDPTAPARATEALVAIGSARAIALLQSLATNPAVDIPAEIMAQLNAIDSTASPNLALSTN